MSNFLVLGAEGVGKSLFLKRLQRISSDDCQNSFDDIPTTIATVGSNLVNVRLDNGMECIFREVGGAMAPIWKNYFHDTDALIYVIDAANSFQISSSCILLLELLSNEVLSTKEILILFNKIDLPQSMCLAQMKMLYRFSDLPKLCSDRLTIAECSFVTKAGFEQIIAWVTKIAELIPLLFQDVQKKGEKREK